MPRRNQTIRTHRTGPKWTTAEDEILLDCIGENPTNLKASFLAASERLPIRSAGACSQRWYSTLAKRDNVIGKLTIGRTTVVRNKSRLTPEYEPTHKKSIIRAIWELIIARIYGFNQ